MIIKNFKNWVNEDFAQVGVAPAGNVVGMGDVAAPTSSSTGSGDAWPSLSDPYSLVPLKKKKKRKKKKRKLNESHEWIDNESAAFGFFPVLAKAGVGNMDDSDWTVEFDKYYGEAYEYWGNSLSHNKLRSLFAEGKYDFECFSCEIIDQDYEYTDEEESALHDELQNNWELFDEQATNSEGYLNSIFYKEFSLAEKNKLYQQVLPKYLRSEGKDLANEEYQFLYKFLTPEEQHKLRGTSTGKKFNL
jgi:hypothetical protein